MSRHTEEQKAPGKYDCLFDSYVHGDLGDHVEFIGSVEYGIVTQKIELTEDLVPEHELIQMIEHYGFRFLLVQENDQGLVQVVAFETEKALNEEYERMDADFTKWCEAVGEA